MLVSVGATHTSKQIFLEPELPACRMELQGRFSGVLGFWVPQKQTMLTPGILRMRLRFPKTDGRPWADKLKSN